MEKTRIGRLVEPEARSENEGYPQPPLAYAVDRLEITVALGRWRGRLKVGEVAPPGPLLLFARDDGAPLPWGRALEELLEGLLAQAEKGTEP